MVGFKSGAQLTVPFAVTPQPSAHYPFDRFDPDITNLIYGPAVEVRLPWSLGIELDALHKKLKYTKTTIEPLDQFIAETTATSWEVSMLLKKYLRRFGPLRPYGDVGLSLRHVSGQTHLDEFGPSFEPPVGSQLVFSGTVPTEDLINTWSSGLALGGGVDIQRYSFHVTPEVRYTRWSNESFRNLGLSFTGSATMQSNKNALEFLVSFTFGL